MAALTVLFDFKSPQSYLALRPTLDMLAAAGTTADWQPLVTAPLAPSVEPDADAERGVRHRWHRARYRLLDLRRYAEAQEIPASCFADERLFSGVEGRVAAAAWWLHHEHPRALDLLVELYDRYWREGIALDDVNAVAAVLRGTLGDDRGYAKNFDQALAGLVAQQSVLSEAGFFDAPGYAIAGEVFYGRQHLPMVRWHLEGASGPAPAWGRAPD